MQNILIVNYNKNCPYTTFDNNSLSALAKAVMQVINDKELAMTMGLAARKKVEQEFSVEKMISETEKVYLSLLKEKLVIRS